MNLKDKLLVNGGFTVDRNGRDVESGYAVATQGNEAVYTMHITESDILEYIAIHKEELSRPTACLGGWVDTETNQVYLDVSDVYQNGWYASEVGHERDQIAIFDLDNMREIRLK